MTLRRVLVLAAVVSLAVAGSATPASAAEPATVTVTVVSAHGFPAANTSVAACAGTACTSSVSTDSAGRATITTPGPGRYAITANYRGIQFGTDASATATADLASGVNALSITLTGLHLVTGSFTGAGAASVTSLSADTSNPFGINYTEGLVSGGTFTLVDRYAPFIDEQPFFFAYKAGGLTRFSGGGVRASGATAVTAAAPFTIDVPAAAGGSVTGRVADAAGVPFASTAVRLSLPGGLGARPTTVTDATGGFRFDGLVRGVYFVSVIKPESGVAQSAGVRVEAGASVDTGTIVAARATKKAPATGTLIAKIVDRKHEFADADPMLTIVDSHGVDWSLGQPYQESATTKVYPSRSVATKRSGSTVTVKAAGLPAGTYTVGFQGGPMRHKVRVKSHKRTSAGTFTARVTTAALAVTVKTPDGKPVKTTTLSVVPVGGFTARLNGATTTSSNGRTLVPRLAPGRYVVRVLYNVDTGMVQYGPTVKVTVPKKATKKKPKKVTIVVPTASVLSGTVVSPSGAAVSGMRVAANRDPVAASRCQSDATVSGLSSFTDAAGHYALTIAPTRGTYYVTTCDTIEGGYLPTQSTWKIKVTGATATQDLTVG